MIKTELRDDMQRLKSWAKSLENSTEHTYAEIHKILDSQDALPSGCPSRGSLAAMAFRNIEKKLDEVNGAAQDIRKRLLE